MNPSLGTSGEHPISFSPARFGEGEVESKESDAKVADDARDPMVPSLKLEDIQQVTIRAKEVTGRINERWGRGGPLLASTALIGGVYLSGHLLALLVAQAFSAIILSSAGVLAGSILLLTVLKIAHENYLLIPENKEKVVSALKSLSPPEVIKALSDILGSTDVNSEVKTHVLGIILELVNDGTFKKEEIQLALSKEIETLRPLPYESFNIYNKNVLINLRERIDDQSQISKLKAESSSQIKKLQDLINPLEQKLEIPSISARDRIRLQTDINHKKKQIEKIKEKFLKSIVKYQKEPIYTHFYDNNR